MIEPRDFLNCLLDKGVDFFVGVPDSLLKEFCLCIDNTLPVERHLIAANEGAAVAIASGYQMVTGSLPLVYLQNSGLGNAVNPLLSLTDPEVYGIPMLLLVGWRGEPSIKDEPQHIKQGRITPDLLKAMEIPYQILSSSTESIEKLTKSAISDSMAINGPVVILVKKDVFSRAEESSKLEKGKEEITISREEAISTITNLLSPEHLVISTTGMISRELYEQRKLKKQNGSTDFLTVGSMGHASQIALGIALNSPNRKVVCLDGDGALLMHMGGLSTIGSVKLNNFLHIILNNGAHDSVGGQSTVALDINIPNIALSCGYDLAVGRINTIEGIRANLEALVDSPGCNLLEILVTKGSRQDLGRPLESPQENKKLFLTNLRAFHEE